MAVENPCVLHERLEGDINDIKKTQKERPCQDHTARLKNVEKSNDEQWTAINELRRTVWKWAGVATVAGCVGSVLGGIIMTYLRHGK